MTKSDAPRDRVLHVVIGLTRFRRTLNVLNTYAQRAAKKVTVTRIAQPVNKSISATGHSARECPSKTVNICRKPPSRLELRLLRQLPSRRRNSPQSTSTNSMSSGMLPSLVWHFFAFNCIASIVRIKPILTRPNPTFWRELGASERDS